MKNLFFLIATCILLACNGKVEPPVGLLPKEKMVELLIEIHIADAKAKQLRTNKDSIQIVFKELEKGIFSDHKVEDSIYYMSYDYYLRDNNEIESIYSAVIDSLSLQEKIKKK